MIGDRMPVLPPRVERIIQQTAAFHGIPFEDLIFQHRRKSTSRVRFEAIWRVHTEIRINGLPPSLPQMGRWFGGRDHTTMLHALRRFEQLNPTKIAPSCPDVARMLATRSPAPYRLQMMSDMAEMCA